jgi:hypothetical protein
MQEQKKILESIRLHVTLVKCHTLDRPTAVYIKDTKNMLGTKNTITAIIIRVTHLKQ